MILANGRQYDTAMQDELLAGLEDRLNATLAGPGLEPETVIAAIDRLGRRVEAGVFDKQIAALQIDGAAQYREMAVRLLRRDNLEFMLRTELGEGFRSDYVTQPPEGLKPLRVLARPMGVLLHIAAGNADGLPAFSVAEGLVTGNINLLKLPQVDNGLSLEILQALLDIEPRLADYLYVFDTPSSDVAAIKKMADLSDGIVVWGGETAVAAVRRFAHPGTKLIEWGHRLSFAYLVGNRPDAEARRLEARIVEELRALKLAGTDEETLYSLVRELLTDEAEYARMSRASNPYGDGQASRRIADALQLTELADAADRKPAELSGGMQRRGALARSLVYGGDVFILDEPFTGLDEELKERIAERLSERWRKEHRTVIFVTHDRAEAARWADETVDLEELMRKGDAHETAL